MAESWKKKEREKKKQKEKMDKAEKMQERKDQPKKTLEDMMAYVDENGNITSTPPDPKKRKEIKLEDIQIGVPKYVPDETEKVRTGKVTFFSHDKGFGFIKDQLSQESIFVHINNVSGSLNENDTVSFEVEPGHRGPIAVNVKLL